jgi:hypothetical protein
VAKQWSPETQKLREEAAVAIDKLARAMQNDRTAWGNYDHLNEEAAAANSLDNKQQTAWLVVTQYQGFTDPETSNVIYCTGGQTAATTKGLAMFATEQF